VLSRRLDWTALSELLRALPDRRALTDFSLAAKSQPGALPLLYSASIATQRPGEVAQLLIGQESTGRAALQAALAAGVGGVHWILGRPLAVEAASPAPTWGAALVRSNARLALAGRWILFLLGGAAMAQAVSVAWIPPGPTPNERSLATHSLRTFAATAVALLLIVAGEPELRPKPDSALSRIRLEIPGLTQATFIPQTTSLAKTIMDRATLASIVLFAALQIAVYVICLRKIREIENLNEPIHVKLRLMENEENLFDAGLYLGITGTAAALVLQVLGLVEANLLAAYSSNLMGIVGVAFVKIRHVRPYKRSLILRSAS
jgi:hypothetical protein